MIFVVWQHNGSMAGIWSVDAEKFSSIVSVLACQNLRSGRVSSCWPGRAVDIPSPRDLPVQLNFPQVDLLLSRLFICHFLNIFDPLKRDII